MTLKQLIKESIQDSCNCGCKLCSEKKPTDNMTYHISNRIPISETIFRYGSTSFIELWKETRELYESKRLKVDSTTKHFLDNTDLGRKAVYEGRVVPLDLPMLYEAEYKGEDVELNKPKRGGSKKFYVYVKDPKTKKVKKVSFGDNGLSVKIDDPEARKSFAARHDCKNKKDKTKAGYWSCNIGRYWKSLGGSKNFSGYW